MDYFLKFLNQEEMISILSECNLAIDGKLVLVSYSYILFEIGEIPGTDGWHINIKTLDPTFDLSELEPYRIYPSSPSFVWA